MARHGLRLRRLADHVGPQPPPEALPTPCIQKTAGTAGLKVFISVDIEGAAGIAHWDEADSGHGDYSEFRERMTQEAVAACEGALAAGATEIWVKDAHGSGRNILQEALPREAVLVRGWSMHPYAMVQELDSSFDACCFVGYHGHASHPDNPLSHTNTGLWNKITVNGEDLSEYRQHAHTAALVRPTSKPPLLPLAPVR